MAGSPAPADRPSSEAGPPHWQLGRTGPPGAAPASPACQSPGAYADLGALPAGREGPRAQGPCLAPLFPWKPAADRPERYSVGGRPARGSFPPRPETPIPPRFPASPAAGWGPRHHAAGSAAPAALHPNSALPSGRAEGSALCISQGIPVWGHLGCPPPRLIAPFSQGRQKYLQGSSKCRLSTPLLSCSHTRDVGQPGKPCPRISQGSASSRKPSLPDRLHLFSPFPPGARCCRWMVSLAPHVPPQAAWGARGPGPQERSEPLGGSVTPRRCSPTLLFSVLPPCRGMGPGPLGARLDPQHQAWRGVGSVDVCRRM